MPVSPKGFSSSAVFLLNIPHETTSEPTTVPTHARTIFMRRNRSTGDSRSKTQSPCYFASVDFTFAHP
jgi:hypothetical protein